MSEPVEHVLVDDLRGFRDQRACLVARTSAQAIALLSGLAGTRIEHLWLDHDLGQDDDVSAVVALLEEHAVWDRPLDIGLVHVHSANPVGAARVVAALDRWGYRVRREGTDELVNVVDV